jgi:hypothetical protein
VTLFTGGHNDAPLLAQTSIGAQLVLLVCWKLGKQPHVATPFIIWQYDPGPVHGLGLQVDAG